jgi:NAD(P)-dependent dehydrogenase (short-subunit alcohol dehydrogenase family)
MWQECLAVSPLAASCGERALVRVLDMGGETEGLAKAAAEVAQAMGQIDILINNAGRSCSTR